MGIVKQDQRSSQDACWERITRFPHDQVDDDDGKGTEKGGDRSKCDVRNVIGNIGFSDIVKEEMAIVSNDPTDKGKEQLSKGRMNVEEIGALKIVGGELGDGVRVWSCWLGNKYTFPKWTSSKTTSLGWLMPKNRVMKARMVMMARASL